MSVKGFFPCFSEYKHKEFPYNLVQSSTPNLEKVSKLFDALLKSESPLQIKNNLGHDIQTIRPDSKESKKVIKFFSTPMTLHKADYGNNPFRIYFSLEKETQLAYIFAIDTKHTFYNK